MTSSQRSTSGKIAGTILIVDDDEGLRTAMAKLIESSGGAVFTAENGVSALQVLEKEKIDLVLSDIQMPLMNGVELTKNIRKTMGVPIILMTAFTDIIEAQEAYLLGAQDFFAKPVERQELIRAIRGALESDNSKAKATEENAEDHGFFKMAIEDFISGKGISYSIFIKLAAGKFVKIAHKGEDLEAERIRSYKSKGVNHLYLRSEDFKKYVGFNLDVMKRARRSTSLSQGKKLNLVKHTGEILMEQIRHEGLDEIVYSTAANFVETTVQILTDDDDILDLLDILNSHSDYLYAHSVGVSAYSVMMARSMGWTLPANLFKIGMSGILHDIGKKEINQDLLRKPRKDWGPEEVKVYEAHPQRGYESLRLISSVPVEVLQVVMEHHEDCTGNGFPAHRLSSKIQPMAKLVAVANAFTELVLKSPDGPGMAPVDALRQLSLFSRERFDPKFFDALLSIFNFKSSDSKADSGSLLGD